MSKLETNTIDTISGSTNLTLGGTNATDITIPSGVTITNNGTQAGLTLSDNILFNTANKGIYLGVTSATASNLLDDYEEGTWTPTLTCTATGFASVTYDALTGGRYIKVGKLVYITGSVKTDAIDQTGASGNAAIGGLPFNIESNVSGTQSNTSPINIGIANSFAGDVPNSGYYQVNDNKVGLLYRTSVNGDSIALSRLDFDNGADSNVIHFNGTYYST